MIIAFYAPLKPLSSPNPSGDRLIGRLFRKALQTAGHEVAVVSTLRSYDGKGDQRRQRRLKQIGLKKAETLARRFKSAPPDIWFTYHLYRKAPDWLGPHVCRELHIPYVVAEASFAPSQANGAWAEGHQAVQDALKQVDLAIGTTAADEACLLPELSPGARYIRMKPFLDESSYATTPARRKAARRRFRQPGTQGRQAPRLLTVAMMRPGVKFESYQVLAAALRLCRDRSWHLDVVGDGPCRDDVQRLFAGLEDRVNWLGKRSGADVAALYAAADIYLWPSVRESPGMTFLEAQASGVPVIGGDGGGVPDVIANGIGGLLTPKRNVEAFSDCLKSLLDQPQLRRKMGRAAVSYVRENHSIGAAAQRLDRELAELKP